MKSNSTIFLRNDLTRRNLLKTISIAPFPAVLLACGGGGNDEVDADAFDYSSLELLASPMGDVVVFAADDSTNPLHIFAVPITRRIEQLAVDLSAGLERVLPKLQRFMGYIDQFRVGVASAATPDVTVQEKVGACGTYTGLFLAMARCLNIPGRYINFYNWPENDGHTVAEVLVDGRWMVFDPTYHIYYAYESAKGNPLSYEEISSGYNEGVPIVLMGGNGRLGLDGFTGANIYQRALPQGLIGPSQPMLFPLWLDVLTKPKLDRDQFGAENQGAEYIGAAGTNIQQSWDLLGLEPGVDYAFRIVPDWVGGHITSAEAYFEFSYVLSGGEQKNAPLPFFDFRGAQADSFELRFSSFSDRVKVTVLHPYRGPKFRYLRVSQYALYRLDSPLL